MDNSAANLLTTVLANHAHLKVLDLGQISGITTEGWWSVFSALESPRCSMQELFLHYNEFNDEALTYLGNALANNCILRRLSLKNLEGNRVTSSGWRAFAAVLQYPNSALEELDLGGNSINDDVLASFANSLTHNNKLKDLFLESYQDEEDEEDIATITNWELLSNVLCNKSSINATWKSNHTLGRVLDPDEDPGIDESNLPDLRTLLQLNRENTKAEAARRKVISVHFSGDFNVQPFIDMDLKVLPHALAWMARNEHGSSLTYKFVRNTTFFLNVSNVGGGGTEPATNEPESKRQKL